MRRMSIYEILARWTAAIESAPRYLFINTLCVLPISQQGMSRVLGGLS